MFNLIAGLIIGVILSIIVLILQKEHTENMDRQKTEKILDLMRERDRYRRLYHKEIGIRSELID